MQPSDDVVFPKPILFIDKLLFTKLVNVKNVLVYLSIV